MNIKISNGKIHKKKKVVIYGPEGIGKTSLAAHFPKPLFDDTEGSTVSYDVSRFEDKATSWEMLKNHVNFVMQNPDICDTLVIDTMDWAERLCVEDVLAAHNKKGIEDFGYGNGYVYVMEEIGRFLNLLQELVDKGICNVVLTCHSQLKKFEQPNEAGAYDRYELKLGKKTSSQTAPLVKEWADMILFCNYETFAVATDEKNKKFKAQGGQRVMYTEHHPCWDAKNREGLPSKLPLDFSGIAHIFIENASPETAPQKQEAPKISNSAKSTLPTPAPSPAPAPVCEKAQNNTVPAEMIGDLSDYEEITPAAIIIPDNIPKALQDLMRTNNVSEEDIRFAVGSKGYYPESTPISDYDPDFINGALIAAWSQVYDIIKANKKLPF